MNRKLTSLRYLTLILILFSISAIAQVTIIAKESTWKYHDGNTNQSSAMTDTTFNDASWSSADGIFGVGSLDGATITTTINNNNTTYFRKKVNLTTNLYGSLDLNVLCDDGFIIYLNGNEISRDNVGTNDPLLFTDAAPVTISGTDEGDYDTYTVSISPSDLVIGDNYFTAELKNRAGGSSDLGFDLEVIAYESIDSSNYILFKEGAWNYLDDGSDQGTSWVDSGFNDASWSSGDAVLGYGTLDGATVTTTLGYGGNSSDKHPTTYFRKEVTLTNPNFMQLKLYLLADDAAAVYINGKLAIADGMPTTWDFETYATVTASGTDEGDYDLYTVPDTFLVNGVNTFAVEMHQVNATSSDLGFDLEVIGVRGTLVVGQIFMDMDGNGVYSAFDNFGSGAVEIKMYNDADSNGVYTNAEILDSVITDPYANYSMIAPEGVRHLAVKLMTGDMDTRVEFTTDTVLTFTLTPSTDSAIANFGQLGPRSMCLMIADDQNNNDKYYIANRISGKNKYISTLDVNEIESMALRIGMDSAWACDAGQFGTIDVYTGQFTPVGSGVGTGNGTHGGSSTSMAFTDIDGMAYDGLNDIMYATHKTAGGGSNDVLLAINRNTGTYIADFFGAGVDFVEITGTNIKEDVDDIAFNPYTNQLLAINMQGTGDSTRYITINPATGAATVISITGVGDFESLGYYNTGELYGTTGVESKPGYPANSFYKIDRNTGSGTKLDTLYSGAIDVESCDCLTGPTENLISGIVFYDNDSSGTFDQNIDSAYANIKIYLYRDVNNNGVIDSADYIIDSTYTLAGNGFYVFITDSLGSFLTTPVIDGTPLAGNNTTTGDSLTATATFMLHGDYDGKNDFGFHITSGQPYLPVNWLAIDAAWIDTKNAIVSWSTASEVNSSHFIVERQIGTGSFTAIGETQAAGQSNEINYYNFIDVNAKNLESQFVHYRVKQVDYSGSSSVSDIVSLEKKDLVHVSVYPNPVGNVLNINLDAKGDYQILITDMVGNEVASLSGYKNNKFSPIRIEGLDQLRRGLYLVRITYNGEDTIVKLLK